MTILEELEATARKNMGMRVFHWFTEVDYVTVRFFDIGGGHEWFEYTLNGVYFEREYIIEELEMDKE